MTRAGFTKCSQSLVDMFKEAMKEHDRERAALIMQGAIMSALVLIAEVQFDQGGKMRTKDKMR